MVVLAFVINVSVEKFKMRSMCFSFAIAHARKYSGAAKTHTVEQHGSL
jgi:hypothetical protein